MVLAVCIAGRGPPVERGKLQFEPLEGEYVVVWEEDFNGRGHAAVIGLVASRRGGKRMGNAARVQYGFHSNAALDGGGNLVLTAREEAFGGNNYTSARWTTASRF